MTKDSIIPAHTPLQAWDRNPRETDRNWDFFRTYRDMAYPEGIAGKFRARQLVELGPVYGVSHNYMTQLSSSFNWIERATAYDIWVDGQNREAGLSAVQAVAKTQGRILSKLTKLIEREWDKIAARSEAEPTVSVLRPNELSALTQFVLNQQRALAGQGTTGDGQGQLNLNKLGVGDLETLLEMHHKANAIDTTGE